MRQRTRRPIWHFCRCSEIMMILSSVKKNSILQSHPCLWLKAPLSCIMLTVDLEMNQRWNRFLHRLKTMKSVVYSTKASFRGSKARLSVRCLSAAGSKMTLKRREPVWVDERMNSYWARQHLEWLPNCLVAAVASRFRIKWHPRKSSTQQIWAHQTPLWNKSMP